MFCEACGAKNADENRFCIACGKLLELTPQPEEESPMPEVPAEEAPSQPETESSMSEAPAEEVPSQPETEAPAPETPVESTPSQPASHFGFTFPAEQTVPVTDPVPDVPVTMGEWLGIFCLNLIPFVGPIVFLVMLFVWAFGSTKKQSLKSFSRACLLFLAILLGLILLLLIVFAVAGISALLPGYFF